ncbi:MAG: tetratricopeptide repeat protein [Ardenticatenaceae bacterium]|nr:tetratricopeptide repeat protein [Ardenticatenaceae bacterium]MCB9444266.1 tetratricopeptide repeat protein [Ardenticatenaceae bacterium]
MAKDQALFNESLNKGHSYLWDQRWAEAIEAFETAVSITKDEPAPYAGLGDAYMGLDKLHKALESYKLAARHSRGNVIYLRKVAEMQEQLGQEHEAGKTFMALGEMALSRRQLEEAMDNWHRAVRLEPNLLRAHQRLASIYQRQGAVRNAIQEYLAIANIFQNQGENDQALETCKLALQLDPRNPDILTAIELVKQGKRIFKKGEIPLSKQTGVTGMLRQMAISSADDWDPSKQDAETAAPVQDARRLAMEELAGGLFDDAAEEDTDIGKMQRDHLISQALDYQRRAMVNEAISCYEKAIATGEDSMAAHFNLGLLYQDKLRFEDAIREFEHSVTQREYKLASHFALGECYRGRGRIEKAIEHFISVLKIVDLKTVQHSQADRLIELYENLADSLATQGEHDQATAFANALVEFLSHKGWEDKVQQARQRLDSISDAGMMILGDVLTAGSQQVLESLYLSQEYTKRGMYNTAVEEIYRAIQLSHDYLPAHIQLGEVLARQGRREVAAQKFVTVANTFQVRGDVTSALSAYERVVELTPLDLNVRSKLIDLLKRHGQIDRSMEHYMAMGDAYYQLAQVDKARETYQEALKFTSRATDNWRPRILRLMADIDMQRFDWKRALSTYKELREIDPEDERTAITLVDLYYRVGQNLEAIQALDKYLIHLVRSGRGTKVIGILEDMVEQRPTDSNLVDRLSRLYIQQKRIGDAITLLDKLGESQLEAGHTQNAVNTIEKILKLNPQNADSYHQLLSQLKRQLG